MPNRVLKESICVSETINSLSADEEALFVRLVVCCQDDGTIDGRPSVIRATCFPLKLNKVTMSQLQVWLARLESVGLLHPFCQDGKPFYEVNLREIEAGLANRYTPAYREWRKAIFERDHRRCTRCGSTRELQAHHVRNYVNHPERRLDISNGQTLCFACHKRAHGG